MKCVVSALSLAGVLAFHSAIFSDSVSQIWKKAYCDKNLFLGELNITKNGVMCQPERPYGLEAEPIDKYRDLTL